MSNDREATRLSDRNETTRAGRRSLPDIKPRYLTTPGAAIHLGLSPRTLEKHRYYGTGPVYLKLGGRVVYAIDDLDAWAELGARRSTTDPGIGIVHPAKHIASAVLQKKLALKR